MNLRRLILRSCLTALVVVSSLVGRIAVLSADSPRELIVNGDLLDDANGDGFPDGWYNFVGARMVMHGDRMCIRLESETPGKPAHCSQAFALDGRRVPRIEAEVDAECVNITPGYGTGQTPALVVHFLDEDNLSCGLVANSDWTRAAPQTHCRYRFAVPAACRQAIVSVGLWGATGAVTFGRVRLHPAPELDRDSGLRNHDFHLGGLLPDEWQTMGRVERSGARERAVVRLLGRGAAVRQGCWVFGLGVHRARAVARVRGGTCALSVSAADAAGTLVPLRDGEVEDQARGDWTNIIVDAAVPPQAYNIVITLSNGDASPAEVDEVQLTLYDANNETVRTPVATPSPCADDWLEADQVVVSPPADAFAAPIGKPPLVVRFGKFFWADGRRARLAGIAVEPPLAIANSDEAEAAAAGIAAAGFNYVRFRGLDSADYGDLALVTPHHSGSSLSPLALARLDGFAAALRRHHICYGVELLSQRRFAPEAGVAYGRRLSPGAPRLGLFLPAIVDRVAELARQLLAHRQPESGLRWADDHALVTLTLSAHGSLFRLFGSAQSALPTSCWTRLQAAFNQWLTKQYRNDKALARAWGGELNEDESLQRGTVLPSWSLSSPLTARQRDTLQWLRHQQESTLARWSKVVRNCGYRGLLAASANTLDAAIDLATMAEFDFIEADAQWAAPTVGHPAASGLALNMERSALADAARRRVKGKPFLLSGWQIGGVDRLPAPHIDDALLCMTAAAQDWDGAVFGTVKRPRRCWGQPPWGEEARRRGRPGDWDASLSRLAIAPVVTRALRSGLMTPLTSHVTFPFSDADMVAGMPISQRATHFEPLASRMSVRFGPVVADDDIQDANASTEYVRSAAEGFAAAVAPRLIVVAGAAPVHDRTLAPVTLDVEAPMWVLAVRSLDDADVEDSSRLLLSLVSESDIRDAVWQSPRRTRLLRGGEGRPALRPAKATLRVRRAKPATRVRIRAANGGEEWRDLECNHPTDVQVRLDGAYIHYELRIQSGSTQR